MDFVTADLRLVLLRSLADQSDYTLNDSLLQRSCMAWGHNRSRDAVKAQLRWLADVEAVTLKEMGGYLIASITHRGLDHVERRAYIDGIGKPGPEA